MRPKTFDIDPVDSSTTNIKTAGAVAAAGALTLDGTTSFSYARVIGITSAGDDSLITFTIVGIDENGLPLTEVVTGANTSIAESTGYFKEITSITASGAAAGNVSVGTVDELAVVVPLDHRSATAATVNADITGTIDYTIQQTFDSLHATRLGAQSATWTAITAFSAKTADVLGAASVGATGIRFITNSFTNGAECQMSVAQPNAN